MLDEYDFALCLTHDVDRPYKTYQSLYYGLKEFDFYHIKTAFSKERPYWQFENIMELEEELGVRSTFYFLNEKNLLKDKSPKEWFKPKNWKLYTGRYDIQSDEIKDIIRKLDKGGWEVGLHGSYESYDDIELLKYEKEVLEDILGHEIHGIRQHYLNLKTPDTWENHRKVGLRYDASLGSNDKYGFHYGYKVKYPFDDDFAVFPLAVMDSALMGEAGSIKEAWEECERILSEAKKRNAVMTILWHLRMFNKKEYPDYSKIYRKLIETAQKMDAWVGPIKNIRNSKVA